MKRGIFRPGEMQPERGLERTGKGRALQENLFFLNYQTCAEAFGLGKRQEGKARLQMWDWCVWVLEQPARTLRIRSFHKPSAGQLVMP